MTRRRLLVLFIAILAASGGVWWSRRGRLDAAAARLVDTVTPRTSAAQVGAEALASLPTGSAAEHLVVAIAQALGLAPEALTERPADELRQKLQARLREEHLSGDTLSVQGWELSRSEARLYALAFLTRG